MSFVLRLCAGSFRVGLMIIALMGCICPPHICGQATMFGGDAQHTGIYPAPAQRLNGIHWSVVIDAFSAGAYTHYGAPVITLSNTVIVGIKTNSIGFFRVSAFEGATGRLKYTQPTDYRFETSAGWTATFQPAITAGPSGPRLYFPGARGTIYYVDNADSDSPGPPVQECFYTDLTNYYAHLTNYGGIFIDTPLTTDLNGNVFFGFTITGTPPAPFNSSQDGFARIDASGAGSYVMVGAIAGSGNIRRNAINCAPALSHDGSTLYVVVKNASPPEAGYLAALDSTTLATRASVRLADPLTGNNASVSTSSTASPLIGPDGDVFLGVLAETGGSRGLLLHYSADLQTRKLPGGFGWDNTPAIVPTNMVPSYKGSSSYLLFSKYNNYAGGDGNGINKVALLDPNSAQLDPHPSAAGLAEMREVLIVTGCRADARSFATPEWCINAPAVNPSTKSIFAPSEDGQLYRWDLAADALIESTALPQAVGEPYVPVVIGPDGTVYTLNTGKMFAFGALTNVAVGIFSSAPGLRGVVAGDTVTFSAVVSTLDPLGPLPTGSVTFQDRTYVGSTFTTYVIASAVPLSNGLAVVSTSSLAAGGTYPSNCLGNHFITAVYSGDQFYRTGSAMLFQKVHTSATTTFISASLPTTTNTVVVSARVSPTVSGVGVPTGMVSFWDGSNLLGQVALDTNAIAATAIANPSGTNGSISAVYASDTLFASSSGNLTVVPYYLTASLSGDGKTRLNFSNLIGSSFTVFGATDLALPLSNWSVLGPATEIGPGKFQLIDRETANFFQRFYRVRSP